MSTETKQTTSPPPVTIEIEEALTAPAVSTASSSGNLVPLAARKLAPRFRKDTTRSGLGINEEPSIGSFLQGGGPDGQEIDFANYSLPPVVQNAKKGWESSLNAVAIVTTLIVGAECELIGNLPAYDPNEPKSVLSARLFCYVGVFLNLGGTLASVMMIDALSDLTTRAREMCMTDSNSLPHRVYTGQAAIPSRLLFSINERELLYSFGLEIPWGFMNFYWAWSFPVGSVCIIIHLLIYCWAFDSKILSGVLTPVAAFAVLPLVAGFIQTRRG
ncbi:hypothetical protein FRC02_003473 [Tulasnella sp. 418]|nr:hypothetical protein FRC02_003473 [Tulasnella sp. 418]